MQSAAVQFQKSHSVDAEIKGLFLENPNLSVDTVARALATKYRHRGPNKGQISRIRHEVRIALTAAQTPTAPPMLRHERKLEVVPAPAVEVEVPFNGIRWGEEEVATPSEQMKTPMESFPESTRRERIGYLEEYVLANPNSTISAARSALKERFGQAVGTKAICDALAAVRDYAREPEAQLSLVLPRPSPSMTIDTLVKAMRELGLKQIRITPEGKWEAQG